MKKTCLPCPPQRIEETTGNEFYTFSFFEDILRVAAINDITLLIQDTIFRLTTDICTYIQKYVLLSNEYSHFNWVFLISPLLTWWQFNINEPWANAQGSLKLNCHQVGTIPSSGRIEDFQMNWPEFEIRKTFSVNTFLNSFLSGNPWLMNYFLRWHKYEHLWSFDKNLSCEKYVAKFDQIFKYDEKFFFFEDIISDLDEHVKFVDIGAIRVNLRPVIKQVQDHAQEWKNILGNCIATKTRMNMYDLKNTIEVSEFASFGWKFIFSNREGILH